MSKIKTKRINFRVEGKLYEFIKEFAKANGMGISELCRNVLVYFHIGYLTGEFTKTLPEMKKEFMKRFDEKKEKPKSNKKIIEGMKLNA